jgi:nudix-type nucleoside diphosphatase (YffH/AdpP family)
VDPRAHDRQAEGAVRVRSVELLAEAWGVLRRTHLDLRRPDGTWSEQVRETYDRGDGATILLHDPERDTVLLVRQFRYPAYVNGHPDGYLLEAPAGLLDHDDPATAIRREAEEETGVRVAGVERLFELYLSPGSVTERIAFFTATYRQGDATGPRGGDDAEDIELVELTLDDALAAVRDGRIVDGKTVILLQHAALARSDRRRPA